MKPKLKPCPWCGTLPKLEIVHEAHDPSRRLLYAYGCHSGRCPALLKMGWEVSQAKAAKLWNTRRKPRKGVK